MTGEPTQSVHYVCPKCWPKHEYELNRQTDDHGVLVRVASGERRRQDVGASECCYCTRYGYFNMAFPLSAGGLRCPAARQHRAETR